MSPSMSLERDDQGHDRHSPAPKPVAKRLPFGRAVMARMGGGWKWLLSQETGRPCAPSFTHRRCDSTPRPSGYLPAPHSPKGRVNTQRPSERRSEVPRRRGSAATRGFRPVPQPRQAERRLSEAVRADFSALGDPFPAATNAPFPFVATCPACIRTLAEAPGEPAANPICRITPPSAGTTPKPRPDTMLPSTGSRRWATCPP